MLIAGIDEAGRGPCMGPLVMAVAVIDQKDEEKLLELGVKDSKMLSAAERNVQFPQIKKLVKEHGTFHISPQEIDSLRDWKSLNEIEAMRAAHLLNALKHKPDMVFVDSPDILQDNFGKRIEKFLSFNVKIRSEHKADVNYPVCSAASILAKVERDAAIAELAKEFGKIGSGYPSDEVTVAFLHNWLKSHSGMPPFVRHSWDTTKRVLDSKFQQRLV
ncbi:MAG: ribonuclease HII [Candidatus Diapherotrites archaeon]